STDLAQLPPSRAGRIIFANRFGAFAGGSQTQFQFRLAESPTATAQFTVDERLTTKSVGVVYALGARGWVSDRFSVHGGALLGLQFIHIHLRGSECQDNFVDTAGCQPFVVASVSRSINRVGVRLGFQVGADYDLGFAVLGLTGRLDFDSAVPKVTN